MRAFCSGNQNKSVLLRILIVVFFIYLVISVGKLVPELRERQGERLSVETQINETQARIDEINNLIENGTEEEILEKAARDRLGYVYPNEQVFVDISGN